MNVCYFGPYDPDYPRNRVFIKGLRKNDVNVIECNAQSSNRLLDFIRVLKRHQGLDYDVVILGAHGNYFGQPLVPLVRRITRKPLVFDAMLTLYETIVIDRHLVDGRSTKAKLLYLVDRSALRDSSLILSDTNSHAKYYSHFYDVELTKFKRILVGSDDEFFYPREGAREDNCFLVMFWGGFIPLQGVQYIIRAGRLLKNYKDIKFELRGFGQTHNEALDLCRSLKAKNITFDPTWVPYNELPREIARADICLGIFGETEKAGRVIPNKAVETLAMKKPLITGDSTAEREILVNMENCILVPMANPKAITEAILMLKEDKKLRKKIAEKGHELFRQKLTPSSIGKELKSTLMRIV